MDESSHPTTGDSLGTKPTRTMPIPASLSRCRRQVIDLAASELNMVLVIPDLVSGKSATDLYESSGKYVPYCTQYNGQGSRISRVSREERDHEVMRRMHLENTAVEQLCSTWTPSSKHDPDGPSRTELGSARWDVAKRPAFRVAQTSVCYCM